MDRTGSLLSPSIPDRLTLWSPPPNPVTKNNVDASWKIGSSVAWVGLVVQDFGSRCIAVKRAQIHVVGKTFQSCSWSSVLRSAIAVADFIDSNFTPEMRDLAWAERPPSSFVRILNNDGLSCPLVV
ncbi:hypothetical protein ACFX1X_022703 [Malus domestica]